MIEDDFDVSFIAKLALQEQQIQQNDRPRAAMNRLGMFVIPNAA